MPSNQPYRVGNKGGVLLVSPRWIFGGATRFTTMLPNIPSRNDAIGIEINRLSLENSRFQKHGRPRYGTNPLSRRV
jgi:hypothetical protein